MLPVFVTIIKCLVPNRDNFIHCKNLDKSGSQSITKVQGRQKHTLPIVCGFFVKNKA